MVQQANQADSRSIATVALGYLFLGVVGVADSLGDIWYPSNYTHGVVMLEALGLLLVLIGVLAYWNRQMWDAVLFIVSGVGAWTYQAAASVTADGASGLNLSLPPGEPLSYQGWYFFFLSVFYGSLMLSSMKTQGFRKIFITAKTVQFFAAAIACWFEIAILQPICGYIGVFSGMIATAIAGIALYNFGKDADPNQPRISTEENG